MSNAIRFTKQNIDALPIPSDGKRCFYYDDKVRGLCVQVTAAGAKTFYLRYKFEGKTIRFKLADCNWKYWSIESIRKLAEKTLGEVVVGQNPAGKKREVKERRHQDTKSAIQKRKQTVTFGELFRRYIDDYARTNVKTWREAENNYARYFKRTWDNKEVSLIQRSEVQRWVNDLAEGKYAKRKSAKDHPNYDTANRNFKTLRAVIRWGINKDLVTVERTPYEGIDLFYRKVKARERFVQPGKERDDLIRAISEEPDAIMRDFFWMLLLTGARKSNVLSMRWDQIHFDRRTWTIPISKNGDPLDIALTDVAIKVLERRREAQSDPTLIKQCGWVNVRNFVFPGTGRSGHLARPFNAWRRILKNAKLQEKDLRIHDLRRTVGSYMAMQGFSPVVIAKSLGHRSLSSTQIYTRLNQDPVRDALEKVEKMGKLDAAIKPSNSKKKESS
jgi:integrase